MTLREEFIKSLSTTSSNVDLLLQGRNENYIQWLEEKVKKLTSHNSSSCDIKTSTNSEYM